MPADIEGVIRFVNMRRTLAGCISAFAALIVLVALSSCGATPNLQQQLGLTDDVQLTVEDSLQQAAESALDSREGCIVVMDTRTGRIRALASGTPERGAHKACQLAIPGSLFKTVTLAAALDARRVHIDSRLPSPSILTTSAGVIRCNTETDASSMTLRRAYALSANTVFAQLAWDLGSQLIIDEAEKLGFDADICADFPCERSTIQNCDQPDDYVLGWLGCGQTIQTDSGVAGPLVTPLHMAELFAAFGNGGTVVQAWVDASHGGSGRPEPVAQGALQQSTIDEMNSAMEAVVQEGTGKAAAVAGVDVRGKTGTAENADQTNTGWFCGNAKRGDAQLTIVVQLEDLGSADAASVAAQVIEQAF